MQMSHRYSLIHVITKLGLLYVYDLETATLVYRNKISPEPIFLASEASSVGGFYAINRRGQVLLATVNDTTIVSFVSGQLNNLELAVDLAQRGNLPGEVNLVVQHFQELFAQTKYKEAAELAAESPLGILRTPNTIAKLQCVTVQGGQTPPLLQYFGTILTKGKLSAFESLELSKLVSVKTKKEMSQLVMNQNQNLVDKWLAKDKLECTEKLEDLLKTLDNDLSVKIYMKAEETSKSVLVQGGQTPPLLQYFSSLLIKGKLDAFESLEFSQLVMYQNKKNLLHNSLAENKLECTKELGDLVKTVDDDLALKIYIKARATPKVVEAFAERREFAKFLIYSKQVGYTPPDFQFLLQTILRSDSRGAVKFALMMSRMEGGCPVDYSTITDLFLQRKLIREATTFLLDVLKPNLPEHAFLQTKVLEINIVTFPSVVDAILTNGMFSYYDRARISQLCKEAGLYVELFRGI